MSSPPVYSPSASAPASATVAPSLFAVRVEYRGCAPKNAMASLDDHGTCLEARIDDDEGEVVLIVSAQDRNIARCCTQIADALHGTIVRCERITTDEQRHAALRPARVDSDSDSDSDPDTKSESEVDRLTRSIARRTRTGWAIISLIFIVIAYVSETRRTNALSL